MLPVSNMAVVILLASHSLFGQKLDKTICLLCGQVKKKKPKTNKISDLTRSVFVPGTPGQKLASLSVTLTFRVFYEVNHYPEGCQKYISVNYHVLG